VRLPSPTARCAAEFRITLASLRSREDTASTLSAVSPLTAAPDMANRRQPLCRAPVWESTHQVGIYLPKLHSSEPDSSRQSGKATPFFVRSQRNEDNWRTLQDGQIGGPAQ
jgi:hypothetical protein